MAGRLSFRTKLLAGFSALVVLAGALLAYQILHRDPPSFRRGGEFAAGASTSTTAGTTGTTGTTRATGVTASTSGEGAPEEAGSPASSASSRPAATAATTTTRKRSPGTTRATAAAPPPTTRATAPPTSAPAAPPPSRAEPAGPALPRLGTYTYSVDGEESVSFFGSRRFPEEMTTVVHAGEGLEPNQLVFDLTYSEDHEEREIVSFRDDGIYFDFEGGSVTFGPRTETNEGDYDPPILQVPARLEAGYTRSGTSEVKRNDGSISRTEDWTVRVVGQESLSVAGATVETWKIETERTSRPGSSEVSDRSRTYWYDPARTMWVRFVDVLHGERKAGAFTFTYDSRITAQLSRFSPS